MTFSPSNVSSQAPSPPIPTLISPPGDARNFRRYPVRQESGIRSLGEFAPMEASIACAAIHRDRTSGNFHLVHVHNLSMTGLYFVTKLPYRAGLRMEVRIPLEKQVIYVVGIVRRLDKPAATAQGRINGDFGCGVDFVYGMMSAAARRAIMNFLLEQAKIANWNDLPYIRNRSLHLPLPKSA